MLIAGAKGFAKQLLEVVFQLNLQQEVVFYDDYDDSLVSLYDFPVLKSTVSAGEFFRNSGNEFALGTGNPKLRATLKARLGEAGGNCVSLISPLARIARYAKIGNGSTILTGAIVENDACIGEGVLLNLNSLICHDCKVGDFVEISPGAILTGACSVGDYSFIGSGAVLKPGVRVGRNAIVGAGAVVIADVPDNAMVAGVPARFIKSV